MSPSPLFQIVNILALPGWFLLMVAPRWIWTEKIITGIIVTLLAGCYIYCITLVFTPAILKNFGTLDGIMQLFTNKTVALAGWIHYLAFDLMIGLFETKNAQKHNIHQLLVIPCLLFTFLLGPVGLLLYFLVRIFATKNYFAANF